MVGGDETAGAGHVLDDDRGIPRDVPAEVRDGEDAWHPEDALFAPLYASDGQLLRSFPGPQNGASSLAFHPNGKTLAVGGLDGALWPPQLA
jgi:WD40 repeat protein